MNAAAKDGSANWAVAPGRDTRTVRADLLRYLITGGCDGCKVHDLGVQLKGAYVLGLLDLNYAQAKGATRLGNCHFEQIIVAQYCRFSVLSLEGSNLQNGMNAQGAETVGSVHLRNMVSAEGGVALNSAKIGGQLACENAQFFVDKGTALQLHNIQVAEFYWRDIASITGRLDLSGAHFDTLVDDPESWDKVSDLILIGLTYDHISSPGDTGKRLEWLNKGDTGNGEFSPQPYTQLAKVLRNMGHDRDARKILIEGETRHQRSGWKDLEKRSDERPGQYILNAKDRLRVWGLKAWSFTLRRLIGYSYKPFNSLWALVFLTLLASGISHKAWKAGVLHRIQMLFSPPRNGRHSPLMNREGLSQLRPRYGRPHMAGITRHLIRLLTGSTWSSPSSISGKRPLGHPLPRGGPGDGTCGGCAGFSPYLAGSSPPWARRQLPGLFGGSEWLRSQEECDAICPSRQRRGRVRPPHGGRVPHPPGQTLSIN